MDLFTIEELCEKSILCRNVQCDLSHPRCFAGICILGLKMDKRKGKCDNHKTCSFHHFSQKKLFGEEMFVPSINGVYRFNICRKLNCYQPSTCQFLHRKWAEGKCTDFFFNKCDEEHNNHISWKNLQQQVHEEYAIKLQSKNNPENNLNEYEGYFKENKICIKNFQGLCDKKQGECIYQHFDWEESDKIKTIQRSTLQSCIEKNNIQNYQIERFPQSSKLFNDRELQRMQLAIQDQNIVDVIFIMDFTGSMQDWIDQGKSHIQEIMEFFKKKIPQCTLRMGFVGYRDFSDQQSLVFHELTNDTKSLVQFIQKQKASGGGDIAEDVCSGIQKAMELNISKHPKSLLITILFADAPCHGAQYHNGVTDFLADQVEQGKLENLMKRYDAMKQNNYFTCVNIKNITEKMFQIMKENFQNLTITDPSQHTDFDKQVKLTITKSISASQCLKTTQYKATFAKPKYTDLNFNSFSQGDQNQLWQKVRSLIFKRYGETVLEKYDNQVDNQLDEGTNYRVSKFYDVTLNQFVALKVNKEVFQAKQLSETEIQNYSKYAEQQFDSQSIAWLMANEFRKETQDFQGAPPIFFALPILYTFSDSKQFHGLQKIYGEIYIDIKEDWVKYSNNGDYFDGDKFVYQSFSHYVFEKSRRWFTFTDLQGKRNLFSDPAIQSVQNFENYQTNYFQNINNLKDQGMGNFLFKQHQKCSIICQKLGLKNVNSYGSVEIEQSLWKVERDDGKIDVFCESCENQFAITSSEYSQKLYKKCFQCQSREQDYQQNICKCCKQPFTHQLNQQIKTNSNPTLCQECKAKCPEIPNSKNSCFYCNLKCSWNINQYQIPKNLGEKVWLCNFGIKYLNSFYCEKCGSPYKFSKLITLEEYKQRKFICGSCLNI